MGMRCGTSSRWGTGISVVLFGLYIGSLCRVLHMFCLYGTQRKKVTAVLSVDCLVFDFVGMCGSVVGDGANLWIVPFESCFVHVDRLFL